MVLYKVRGVGVSTRRIWSGHEQILYQVDQNFQTKKLLHLIFFKVPKKLFFALRINLEDTLIFGRLSLARTIQDGSLKFEERRKENKENKPVYIQPTHHTNIYQ